MLNSEKKNMRISYIGTSPNIAVMLVAERIGERATVKTITDADTVCTTISGIVVSHKGDILCRL